MEVADTDKDHLITWSNEKAIDLFSMKIIDKPVTKIIPAKTWGKIYPVLLKSHKIENIRFKKRDNIYELTGFFIKTDNVLEKGRIQLIIKDITEDIKLSIIDSLTCLYNRRFINEVLMKETERSSRLNKKFSLVMFDLDDFKKVNDLYGHFAGDNVLKSIAKLTDKGIRKADIAGRYGGEEFVIIMPETDKKTAYRVTERLRTKIGNKEIMTPKKKKITITASFGIASYPEDGTSPEDLLLMSDERLYKAKKEGKNRTVFE
jgi:diguanylate cyclase (GGDEF)-like protein